MELQFGCTSMEVVTITALKSSRSIDGKVEVLLHERDRLLDLGGVLGADLRDVNVKKS